MLIPFDLALSRIISRRLLFGYQRRVDRNREQSASTAGDLSSFGESTNDLTVAEDFEPGNFSLGAEGNCIANAPQRRIPQSSRAGPGYRIRKARDRDGLANLPQAVIRAHDCSGVRLFAGIWQSPGRAVSSCGFSWKYA